ncbi:MAG: gluconate 5-dehydrogenase [Hymenobacter sp.]
MSTPNLQGNTILITGGASGLGLAMAKALASAGASVLLTGRNPHTLHQALEALQQPGFDASALVMDVREEQSVQAAVDWVRTHWGRLDMLVNNAGIGMRTVNPAFLTDPQPFYTVSAAGFRDVIDTNLTGYFLVAKAFVPLFLGQGRGKIVNISMNHETMVRPGFVPYGPSRAGAEALSRIMAEDLRPHRVDVNLLLPGGATDTGMIPAEAKAALAGKFTLLSPDVMAEPILFLASAASDGITAERIVATHFAEWRAAARP